MNTTIPSNLFMSDVEREGLMPTLILIIIIIVVYTIVKWIQSFNKKG